MEVKPERLRNLVISSQFLGSVCELPKEYGRKILKALDLFVRNPSHPSLDHQGLRGKASGIQSIRADDSCRILFSGERLMTLLYAGSPDRAYRFAERAQAEHTALAESPIAYQLRGCADLSRIFEPVLKSESPSCGVSISTGSLDRLIMRARKYLPLAQILLSRGPEVGSIELSFPSIEAALRDALPKSALTDNDWWANDPCHVQADSWLAVGWRTTALNLRGEKITFSRTKNEDS